MVRRQGSGRRSRQGEPQRDGFVSWFTASTGGIAAWSILRCWRDFSHRRFLPKLHPVQSGGVFFLSGGADPSGMRSRAPAMMKALHPDAPEPAHFASAKRNGPNERERRGPFQCR